MGKERSYLGPRPTSITDQRRWWWTHQNLRSVRGVYRAMIKNNTLFTYLKPLITNPQARPYRKTTSPCEGTINAAIKRLLSQHRGLSIDHACRPAEWYLNTKTSVSRRSNPTDHPATLLPRTTNGTTSTTNSTDRPNPRYCIQPTRTMGRWYLDKKRLGQTLPRITPTRPTQTHFLAFNPGSPYLWEIAGVTKATPDGVTFVFIPFSFA